MAANDALADATGENPEMKGMGSTAVAAVDFAEMESTGSAWGIPRCGYSETAGCAA